MNILFLKLYITNEINNAFYNSQEIGMAKAITELNPSYKVDIVLLARENKKAGDENTSNHSDSAKCIPVTDRITLHIIPARGIGHHGMIDLNLIGSLKPDLLHILADNMLFAPNVIRYCLRNGIKYHLYIGTLFTDSNKWHKKAANRLLLGRNIRAYRKSSVYVKTPAVLKQCEELGIKAKLAPVGMNAEDTLLSEKSVEEIRDKYGLPQDKKILLFVGRLEEYKHPREAVEILRKMRSEEEKSYVSVEANGKAENSLNADAKALSENKFHLLVVGNGSLKETIHNLVKSYGLNSSFTHLSKVPNSEMKDLFKACDFYINFNPDEIYGMAILEAMCHRCPVLAISAPGPKFLIDDGKTGFVCGSVEDMAKDLGLLTEDEQLYASMQDAGRKKVANELTWQTTVKKFDDIL